MKGDTLLENARDRLKGMYNQIRLDFPGEYGVDTNVRPHVHECAGLTNQALQRPPREGLKFRTVIPETVAGVADSDILRKAYRDSVPQARNTIHSNLSLNLPT